MKKNSKGEDEACFILHSISAFLFTLTGILKITSEGFKGFTSITDFALGVTFGSLAYIYFKRFKSEK